MTKPGLARPVVFPMKNDLRENIVLGCLRTLNVTKKELEDFLNPSKKGRLVMGAPGVLPPGQI